MRIKIPYEFDKFAPEYKLLKKNYGLKITVHYVSGVWSGTLEQITEKMIIIRPEKKSVISINVQPGLEVELIDQGNSQNLETAIKADIKSESF